MRLLIPSVFALCFFPTVASAQTCASALFGDGTCDCGCGRVDPDCPAGAKFTACQRAHCAAGTVPWEHQPETCMTSACGDGWNDRARGEVCDDRNAVSSGGCAASCVAVNAGYVCGERASGCQVAPLVDGGQPDAGAMNGVDAGAGGGGGGGGGGSVATGGGSGGGGGIGEPTSGCSTAGPAGLLWLGLVLARRWRPSARAVQLQSSSNR